jgi:putative ABC transport system substrate-binding protein
MKSKCLFWVLTTVLLTTVALTDAQQAKKVYRIGYLSTNNLTPSSANLGAFWQGLRELGYVEGKNIIIEYPKAGRNLTRPPARAAELVRLKVDVIVTTGATNTRAAKEATTTIPMSFCRTPIRSETVS